MLDNEAIQEQRYVRSGVNSIETPRSSMSRQTSNTVSSNSIQHRINIMFNELKGREHAFPYDIKSEFEDAILSSKDTELEVKYWESLAKRR